MEAWAIEDDLWRRDMSTVSPSGSAYVQKDLTSQTLYAHCEEREWGFRAPEDIEPPHRAFLTLLEEFETENPTEDEISRSPWAHRIVIRVPG